MGANPSSARWFTKSQNCRCCVKVEMAADLGSLSQIVLVASVECKATLNWKGKSEPRNCVKVEVAVLGSPSLTVLMVSVDVKQH